MPEGIHDLHQYCSKLKLPQNVSAQLYFVTHGFAESTEILEKFKDAAVKKALCDYIKGLPDDKAAIAILQNALNEKHPLGKIFFLKRKFLGTAPGLGSGTLGELQKELDRRIAKLAAKNTATTPDVKAAGKVVTKAGSATAAEEEGPTIFIEEIDHDGKATPLPQAIVQKVVITDADKLFRLAEVICDSLDKFPSTRVWLNVDNLVEFFKVILELLEQIPPSRMKPILSKLMAVDAKDDKETSTKKTSALAETTCKFLESTPLGNPEVVATLVELMKEGIPKTRIHALLGKLMFGYIPDSKKTASQKLSQLTETTLYRLIPLIFFEPTFSIVFDILKELANAGLTAEHIFSFDKKNGFGYNLIFEFHNDYTKKYLDFYMMKSELRRNRFLNYSIWL